MMDMDFLASLGWFLVSVLIAAALICLAVLSDKKKKKKEQQEQEKEDRETAAALGGKKFVAVFRCQDNKAAPIETEIISRLVSLGARVVILSPAEGDKIHQNGLSQMPDSAEFAIVGNSWTSPPDKIKVEYGVFGRECPQIAFVTHCLEGRDYESLARFIVHLLSLSVSIRTAH